MRDISPDSIFKLSAVNNYVFVSVVLDVMYIYIFGSFIAAINLNNKLCCHLVLILHNEISVVNLGNAESTN